ncbi:MAG: C39 family peptidase [Anaerolineae bacterium]
MSLSRVSRWILPALALFMLVGVGTAFAGPSPDDDYPMLRKRVSETNAAPVNIKPLLPKQYLFDVKHQYQGWNNCGPTTTAMAISDYGITMSGFDIAAKLKPNPKDSNVSPDEIVGYIKSQGLDAQVRVNGNRDTIMWFLSNDIPVIVEQWMLDDGGMGHYRLATGFNKERGTVTFDDSFYGPDQRWTWEDFEARWGEFNNLRKFIPVYRPEQAPLVRAILGPDADDAQMWVRAEAAARANIEGFPNDGRTWFALGDALLAQDRAPEALDAYEKGYALGLPKRFYWYQFGHFEALAKLGRWQRLLELTQPVLAAAPIHEEMHYYQGLAYQGLGNKVAARAAFQLALSDHPGMARAQQALAALQ